MKKINKILLANQRKDFNFYTSDQYINYKKNKKILKNFSIAPNVKSESKVFEIICKNALILAISNKKELDFVCKDLFSSIYLTNKFTFEEFLKYYHARIVDLRFFKSQDKEIYIPIYSHVLNDVYYNEPIKLLRTPYNEVVDKFNGTYIDMFETYNFKLFDSTFTKLIKIKEFDKIAAFYDFDSATIFFINSQGRLDYYLPIFDKWMKKINTSGLLNRLICICDCYYQNDKATLIDAMRTNRLISEKMKNYLVKKTLK